MLSPMDQPPAPVARFRFFLLLFICGLLLRLLLAPLPTTGQGDGAEYLALARSLIETGSYSYGDGIPVTFRPPLYPLLIALTLRLEPFFPPMKFLFFLQCLLGALVPPLLLSLLDALGCPSRPSRLAALFSVCLLPFLPGSLMTENLFNPLLLAAALSLYRSRQGTFRQAVSAGILVALATLTRPPALLLLPVFAASRARIRPLLVVSLSCLLCLAPWSLRSSLVAGRPVLVDTNFGYNLYMGNNPLRSYPPDFRDDFLIPLDHFPDWFRHADPAIGQAARDWIFAHPDSFLCRLPGKLARLLSPGFAELADFRQANGGILPPGASLFVFLTYGMEALLALLFLALAPRLDLQQPAPRFVLGTILVFFFLHLVFFGMPRYRQPLLPFFLAGILLGSGNTAIVNPARRVGGLLLVLLLLWGWLRELTWSGF